MNRHTFDLGLRVLLTVVLFAVPITTTIAIWALPPENSNPVLVGVSALNAGLSIAEVIFLVKAAIFPKGGVRWWLNTGL
jgi:hypothetical protein